MDSLKLISDINNRLNNLDERITKTSKSTAVAFSYLYSRINDVNEHNEKIDKINDTITYVSNDLNTTKISSNSYYTILKDSISDISNNVYSISLKSDETIMSLENRITNLENSLKDINNKLGQIVNCPDKYIVVKQEKPFIIKIFNSIHETIYKILHFKQIQKERERIVELEKQRIEEEKQKAIEAEKQKQLKEQQEREEKRKKIQNLLK